MWRAREPDPVSADELETLIMHLKAQVEMPRAREARTNAAEDIRQRFLHLKTQNGMAPVREPCTNSACDLKQRFLRDNSEDKISQADASSIREVIHAGAALFKALYIAISTLISKSGCS